jgi:hypothetical protein
MSSIGLRKKAFSSALNFTILQTVKNECVRFGGHVNIQVNYEILRLKVPKNAPILHNPHGCKHGKVDNS